MEATEKEDSEKLLKPPLQELRKKKAKKNTATKGCGIFIFCEKLFTKNSS